MQVVWLKRDLRLSDHRPLEQALTHVDKLGPVCLLYIHDPKLLAEPDSALQHYVFINECLEEINAHLSALFPGQDAARLTVCHGETLKVFEALSAQRITKIWAHRDTTQLSAFMRDVQVRNWALRQGIELSELPQNNVVPYGARLPSKTFKSYLDQICFEPLWSLEKVVKQKKTSPQDASAWFCAPGLAQFAQPERAAQRYFPGQQLGSPSQCAKVYLEGNHRRAARLRGGMLTAQSLLDGFLNPKTILLYPHSISSPATAIENCSRLSAHLAYGAISDKELFQRVHHFYEALLEKTPSFDHPKYQGAVDFFAQRLYWRFSYLQLFERYYRIEHDVQLSGFENQRESEHSEKAFEAFCAGKTGIPIVDSAILMLKDCGWVNMRLRGTLASFALNDLWLDWRKVGNFLATQFLDYEPAIHWHQITIQGGMSAHCEPLQYKVIKQAQDHDPHGEFVKHWLPALANVPQEYIYEPWRMPALVQRDSACQVGSDYPAPIVNPHAAFEAARSRIQVHREGRVFVPGAYWKARNKELALDRQQSLI